MGEVENAGLDWNITDKSEGLENQDRKMTEIKSAGVSVIRCHCMTCRDDAETRNKHLDLLYLTLFTRTARCTIMILFTQTASCRTGVAH